MSTIFHDIVTAILTERTCGEACWHAREDVCRCSCGGKNHGCLRSANGEQPARMAKIDGVMYRLIAVGEHRDLYDAGVKINQAAGYKALDKPYFSESLKHYTQYYYCWSLTDKQAPARLKYASKSQIEKWPELAAYHNDKYTDASLLWQREVMPEKPAQLRVGDDGEPLADQTPPLHY